MVVVTEAFNRAGSTKTTQVRYTNLSGAAIVKNVTEFVVRVNEQLLEWVAELQSKSGTGDRVRNEEGRTAVGIFATCRFQDQ